MQLLFPEDTQYLHSDDKYDRTFEQGTVGFDRGEIARLLVAEATYIPDPGAQAQANCELPSLCAHSIHHPLRQLPYELTRYLVASPK